jgi:hypothetical protein
MPKENKQMKNNTKAIAVYLDDYDKIEQELTWLYKTWLLHSLEEEYDLVVYYNPTAEERIKNFPGVIPIKMPYTRMAEQYKFLNSHYFCLKEYNEPLQKYDFLLKTDCDVFLTHNLKNYTPSKFMVGEGGYYDQKDDIKISFIKKVSKELNLQHNNMPNVGASFFSKTQYVLNVVSLQSEITEFLLNKYFKENNIDKESGFHSGVVSMIAGEIAINHCFNNQHVNLYSLDNKCWETSLIGSNVLHIHAWHSDIPWSKHAYFKQTYKDWAVSFDEAFLNAASYCQWIATASMETIYKYKKIFQLVK